MIRPITTALGLALALVAPAATAQDSAFDQFLDDAGKALDSGLKALDEGIEKGSRAIDQTLVVPSNPSFGALATAMIGTPVIDSDGKTVAEVADLIMVPDGRVTLVVLRVGGVLGFGGDLVAVEFAALETARHDSKPAYRYRGDLAALPSYPAAGKD
jgi:hypothetical protein